MGEMGEDRPEPDGVLVDQFAQVGEHSRIDERVDTVAVEPGIDLQRDDRAAAQLPGGRGHRCQLFRRGDTDLDIGGDGGGVIGVTDIEPAQDRCLDPGAP